MGDVLTVLVVVAAAGGLVAMIGPLRRRRARHADAPSGPPTLSVPPAPLGVPDPPSAASSTAPSPQDEAAKLQGDLRSLVRRVNAAGGRLPVAAVPAVRAVEDVLRPLLTHVLGQPANPEELQQLRAIVADHLPNAVDGYLALPEHYLATARTVEGATMAEELLAQLQLLLEGAEQLAHAVYESDAQQLAVGRRFLDSKFRRSDLDL